MVWSWANRYFNEVEFNSFPIVESKIWLSLTSDCPYIYYGNKGGGARGLMVIVVGNGHGHSSSNPGREWMYFT